MSYLPVVLFMTFNCTIECQDEDKEEIIEKDEEVELEGEKILNDETLPNTKHLSPEMLKIAKKIPKGVLFTNSTIYVNTIVK